MFLSTATIIQQFEQDANILQWNSFRLDFATAYENKETVIAIIKNNIPDYKFLHGLYAIFDGPECLYIGVGRPIWRRIKSHYKAAKGKDSATRWVQFFSQYQKPLTIYWKTLDGFEDDRVGDRVRELIEHILQARYLPLFEEFERQREA